MKGLDDRLLRDVSRSFYLSLRVLPKQMRRAVSLAYLLARASDTLADTHAVPASDRLELLDGFIGEMKGDEVSWRMDLSGFAKHQDHAGEKVLLESLTSIFDVLADLPDGEQKLVRDVVATITSGQRMDIECFAEGGVLKSEAALIDYCYRVAGCVGVFWTRIGFETMGAKFSTESPAQLEPSGEHFGKGLQLVNILRDLPGDLSAGRCYLPVEDPSDREAVMATAAKWRQQAREWMDEGLTYARRMGGRRLKLSVALPALLGKETLDLLDQADWQTLSQGVKVNRATVKRCAWQAWWI